MRAAVAVGAIVAVLDLGGCSSERAAPSVTAMASAQVLSATKEPSRERVVVDPPERPVAADEPSEEGAAAAAEYFFRLTVYAAASGDMTELEAISGESCEDCAAYVDRVKSFQDSGGYWTSIPEVVIYDSVSFPFDGDQLEQDLDQFLVVLDIRKSGYQFVNGDGGTGSGSPESRILALLVTYSDGWVVGGLGDVPGASSVDSLSLKEP